MFIHGAASNPWETLSSLQATNASAPAANIGVSPFATDGTGSAASMGLQPEAPPTGAVGQAASLSPDVLAFLIWNQSQQTSSAASATGVGSAATDSGSSTPATGAADGTDPSSTSWPSFPSWFPPLSAAGAGGSDALGPNNALGTGGTAAATTPTSQSNTNADPALAAGQPGAAPESSGAHGHHHHHGGFATQSQSDPSDPLANLFGTSAQDGSSTTAANADGSTTTTITYADGSEVTLTTPGQASNGNASPTTAAAAQSTINSNNFLETLIQLQARLFAPTAAAV